MSTLLHYKVLVIKQTVYVCICRSIGVYVCVCVHVGGQKRTSQVTCPTTWILEIELVTRLTARTLTTEPSHCPSLGSSLIPTLDGPFLFKLDFLQDLFVLV